MSKVIQAVRGMNDILPDQSVYWAELEALCRRVLQQYAYHEIRLPLVEATALFKRSVGEATDIVEKEMYTFDDRNGDSLTLRPEGTAGCVRAGLQHGLLHNQIQRLWYLGPMYRHERPQKGRYRQFYQLGVEAYGMKGPDIDAEIILLCARLLTELGLADQVTLQLNTLGSFETRAAYRQQLLAYLGGIVDKLDTESQRRLTTNPLRILDSKNPQMQAIIASAPKITDCLDQESARHFDRLAELLSAAGLNFEINPKLVRGLDYYCMTVFEWVTDALGAQGTVCAGGRYDGLVEQLGGKATPAVGFASGIERLILLMMTHQKARQTPDVFLVLGGAKAQQPGLLLAERLRNALPNVAVETGLGERGFKSQFKRADKSGAKYAFILGADEIAADQVTVKPLRQSGEQQRLSIVAAIELLKQGV